MADVKKAMNSTGYRRGDQREKCPMEKPSGCTRRRIQEKQPLRRLPREAPVRRLVPTGRQLLEDEITLTQRILQARSMRVARVGEFLYANHKGIQGDHSFPELLFLLYGLPGTELVRREL